MAAGSRGKVLARYTLFQIPDLILLGLALVVAVRWWGLSLPAAWLIFGFWIVKDIVLYPVIRIAYRTDGSAADRLAGACGVARQGLDPRGYVRVGSELWSAEVSAERAPVLAGSAIRVLEVRGLTLLVEPLSSDTEGSAGSSQRKRS
jgi:membrane protein implicated in regulation of membrane protease activity